MEMRRGFTLTEIVIYFGLAVLTLGIVVSMFTLAHRTQRQTYSQYLVGGSLSSTVRLIRRELQATALGSIAVAENGPGFSCVSAYDDEGDFSVNGYGVPQWQKHVFYYLDGSTLIRWKKEKTGSNLPLPSDLAASAMEGGSTIMSGLLPSGQGVDEIYEGNPYGGLELSFIRNQNGDFSLSKTNPAQSNEYDTHTRLVEVTLRTFEDRSQPDFSQVSFRVCPRY